MSDTVPPFNQFFPSEDNLDSKQIVFFHHLEKKLKKGEFVDVRGQISYIFIYLYKLLDSWNQKGFERLHEHLIYISEIYVHEKKLSDYCRYWAYDCLLGLKKYEIFLEKTEAVELFVTKTHFSNLRLNIQSFLGLKANPIDILLMVGGRKSKFIINNSGLYRDKIEEVFKGFEENWFRFFDSSIQTYDIYPHLLFSGAVIRKNPELDFKIKPYYSNDFIVEKVKLLSKEAESMAREEVGLPRVGEGWISETELYHALKVHFPQTIVIQHGKPDWLKLQHFDIWFPDWNIAVEYHGEQHFRAIDFFGGEEAFKKNVERDARKENLAKRHGVKLYVVKEGYNLDIVLSEIKNFVDTRKVFAPEGN